MASVRDSMNQSSQSGTTVEMVHGVTEAGVGMDGTDSNNTANNDLKGGEQKQQEQQKLEELKKQQKLTSHDEMADRMRQAADRRVELAKREVERRQQEVKFHEQRLTEVTQNDLPTAEVKADMDEAKQRLNEARFKLVRAEEAQTNTQLAAEKLGPEEQQKLKQGGPMQKLPDSPKEGQQAAAHKPSVREQLKGFFSKKEANLGNSESVSAPKPKL